MKQKRNLILQETDFVIRGAMLVSPGAREASYEAKSTILVQDLAQSITDALVENHDLLARLAIYAQNLYRETPLGKDELDRIKRDSQLLGRSLTTETEEEGK